MPCEDCGNGVWECGPNPLALCQPAGDVTPIETIERTVCLKKDDDGNCTGRVVPGKANCGAQESKYEFALHIGTKEDEDGNCIVHYRFEPR